MEGCPWQVLHVLSNQEKRVAQHLQIRSVEHYLPLYRERVKWTDRTVTTERPLFSGYVFVRPLPHHRVPIISIPGVLRHLGDEEKNTVCCEEIDAIRKGLAEGLILRPHPRVSVGTRVRVWSGVFAGIEGTVTALRHQCKVVICLPAVQQCFSLEVEIENLRVLGQPAESCDSKAGVPQTSISHYR